MKKIIITLLCLAATVFAYNLLTNADFEQPLTEGWIQDHTSTSYAIDRATNYDPDPDYEARVYTGTGSGYAVLYQVVDIPATDIDFSCKAKLYAYDNHTSAWCGAALRISYLNSSGSQLGETRICYKSTQCPWSNSSTMHVITTADSLWHDYSFNIDDELTNLPGVNPTQVAKIKISLFDSTYHC
ncbi:MAG TPA: hypothetical protein ENI34_01195 [candidate division WOR-3 bacterium]|uniref:Uncharacterized protein n=1 Tax=candidate division WOR-3 bacterium TaxID=2052148 RepID=A0A9C9JZ52_UNCW3|nr:hypothetical protein [candidate division WOR-3 bacterium]